MRLRTKTGMARCNRAHLRSSFLDEAADARVYHPIKTDGTSGEAAPHGPENSEESGTCWNHSQTGYYPRRITDSNAGVSGVFTVTVGQVKKGATFFPSGTCFRAVSN